MTKFNFYKVNWVKSWTKLKENQSLWSIKGKIEEIQTNDLFAKSVWIQGLNLVENKGEIEEIQSLKVN
jgi:hypothetical protein